MLNGIRTASTLLVFALTFGLTARSQAAQQGAASNSGNKPAAASPAIPTLNDYTKSPERYFRLDFRVLELSAEGKIASSRSYNEIIVTGRKSAATSSLRTGDRVPVSVSSGQFQYMDMGTKFDVKEAQVDGQILRLNVTAVVSGLASATPHATQAPPIVRETSWHSYVSLRLGKPTILFSSDDSADRGKIEIELTAVPLAQ